MWIYEKRLEFPVNIKEPNAQMAQFIMSQYGGPDGEMGASMRPASGLRQQEESHLTHVNSSPRAM